MKKTRFSEEQTDTLSAFSHGFNRCTAEHLHNSARSATATSHEKHATPTKRSPLSDQNSLRNEIPTVRPYGSRNAG